MGTNANPPTRLAEFYQVPEMSFDRANKLAMILQDTGFLDDGVTQSRPGFRQFALDEAADDQE